MRYIDLHCDALTKEGVPCVTGDSLRRGGCLVQCFAAFLREGEGFARFRELADAFDGLCKTQELHPVRGAEAPDPTRCNALLTVEGGEAIEGDLEKLGALRGRGVRMMTLTWNRPNALGFPNRRDGRETVHGLTALGRQAVERMAELGILPDVSHGSDRLVRETAEICKERGVPLVASHSNAAAVFDVPRNLRDGEIGSIADCGGVVGLNFYADFLSAEGGSLRAVLAHAEHLLRVGGEDLPALGSDFDGIPSSVLPSPAEMPLLLRALEEKFGSRIAEKIAFRNASRVLFPEGRA